MELKENILEAIGHTPLVRLSRITRGLAGDLYAKCEFMNPGGSIKDRIGAYMIEKAEREGKLKPGGTIVEATSGNTGMGLAIAAAVKGYKSIFVMPEKMSEEKRQNLRAFGARVVITPTGVEPESPLSHYSVAARLAKETANSCYMNQYHNLDNRETHYLTTGPELFAQTSGGKFDAVVAGMGTCGTITGLGKYIKEKNPGIKVVGIDPKGSILKELFETGKMGHAHSYKIEGIGEDMRPDNLDFSVIDDIVCVEDKEAMQMTRTLLTREGIFCGTSSGAAVVGAMRWMAAQKNPGRVIVIIPDSGNRYLSKVFNDAWMIENGFLEKTTENRISVLLKSLNKTDRVITAQMGDRVENVVKLMRDAGVSQLPVLKDKSVAGVIAETALLRPLFQGVVRPSDKIDGLVEQNYAQVDESEDIGRLNDIFASGKIALVIGTAGNDAGRVKHVLTKIDLISFLSQQGVV